MSNYTVADKVEGQEWTPADHNAMKIAINSKLDSVSIQNNPAAVPSTNESYSTSAILSLLSATEGLAYKGEITGAEDLNDMAFTQPGYWVGTTTFDSIGNGSVPSEAPGVLLVIGNNNYTIQLYFPIVDDTNVLVRHYIGPVTQWTPWLEMADKAWANSSFMPTPPTGTPTIITNDFAVDLHNSTDLKGHLTLTNNSGSILGSGANITINFQNEYPNLIAILVSPVIGGNIAPYGPPESTQAVIRINEEIPIGGTISFFYLIQ